MESPRSILSRLFEAAVTIAVSVFLIRLAVDWLKEIWWVILIIAVIVLTSVIIHRIKKNNRNMYF